MLLTIAIILLILWALGFFAFHVAGGLIHIRCHRFDLELRRGSPRRLGLAQVALRRRPSLPKATP
jgi:hypothetical protein